MAFSPRRSRFWIGAALIALVALGIALGVVLTTGSGKTAAPPTSSTVPTTSPPPPASRQKILWGAWIGSQFTGTEAPWDTNAAVKFQKLAGKGMSLIHFSAPFAICQPGSSCAYYTFPTRAFENARAYGAIPFFSWGSKSNPIQNSEPDFTLGSLIDGSHDAYIRSWAEAAKAWGHPFFLQFDWEMNGNWYPWGEGANGNRRGQFVQAWRHVHDIFTSVGATNATWVWCPNIDPQGALAPLYSLYPGNKYVDWTCLNGYNRDNPWLSFGQLYDSSYRLLRRIAPTKPIILGEVSSTESGGSKASWIADFLSELPSRYPGIRGFLWFEKYAGGSYPIETSRTSKRAFTSGIASSVFVPNVYRALRDGPIQPPGGLE
jgi:hypothetical protein